MRRSPLSFGALAALVSCLSLGCPGPNAQIASPPTLLPPPPTPPRPKEPVNVVESKNGLGFRLSNADEPEPPPVPAPTIPLSAADTQRLFARLPALTTEPDDVKDFALRASSIPAPRPGETVKEAFPPPVPRAAPPAAAPGPLRVTRHAPDGKVDLAPYVTVSFSAPMVPLTSIDELAKIPVPVHLTPEPPGKWRWLGTQTAMFQPQGRFPMANDYTVDVQAGTRSATGNVLAEAVHFGFATPTLELQESGPDGSGVTLDPVMYARFDQAIDPAALLATMKVTVGTKEPQPVQVRLATKEEMDADANVVRVTERREDEGPLSLGVGDYHRTAGGQYSGNAAGGRVLAFKPVSPLPKASHVKVVFPAGTPSAEGPKKTAHDQAFSFETYGPMAVSGSECEYCNPFSTFAIEFTNVIDQKRFDRSMVSVSPAIADMKVEPSGSSLYVSGRKKGRTKYTVKVKKTITDIHDQTLDADQTLTFDVGPAPSVVFSEDSDLVVADPEAHGHLSVFSVNEPALHVRLYSVEPRDYAAYQSFREERWEHGVWLYPNPPPGKLVFSGIVPTAGKHDELTETRVDLGRALHDGVGQVVAVIEPTTPRPKWRDRDWLRQWIQVTHLGLQAVADPSNLVAWATALGTGAPISGVDVTDAGGSGTTGPDGLARLGSWSSFAPIVARQGKDVTFMPGGLATYGSYGERTRFFTFDDRRMYKPGEDVHVKGWVRNIGWEKGGDVALVPNSASLTLRWTAHDPRGAELSKGTAQLDALGGFDFVVTTPDNANLGSASVSLELSNGATGSHGFQIQEFRRPEFEVSASASEGPNFVGEHAVATVDAKYYAGGGLPNASADWSVTRQLGWFHPPNRDDYAFGNAAGGDWSPVTKAGKGGRSTETWHGTTDAQGTHRLRVDFEALEPPYPMMLSMGVSVADVNRQQWSASTSMLVHPADVYVGLKLDKAFLNAGEVMQVDTLVVDVDGKPVPARPVALKAARIDWEWTPAGYETKEVDPQTCNVTSGETDVRCTLPTKEGGRYLLTALVTDEHGRKSQTQTEIWVMSSDMPPDRGLPEGQVKLVPDKKAYAAGEEANLLLVSTFAPAEGLLVLDRQGIVSTERFRMETTTKSLRVKLDGSLTPNVHAKVLLAGSATRSDATGLPDPHLPRRPAYASGETELSIPPLQRTLAVQVKPRDEELEPAGRTTVDVDVKDARGAAVVGAEVAVAVVDESILALSGYQTPDPVSAFYPRRGTSSTQGTTVSYVELANPDIAGMQNTVTGVLQGIEQAKAAAMQRTLDDLRSLELRSVGALGEGRAGGGAPMRAMGMESVGLSSLSAAHGAIRPAPAAPAPSSKARASAAPAGAPEQPSSGPPKPITVRSDFNPLALFVPAGRTDASGHAEFPVKLPDSLTRYRVMVVAAAGNNLFGSSASAITARLPLMVRPSAPRFLNFGDHFELPVVVQNQTDKPATVDLAVRVSNATIAESPGKRMIVPAHDRVEVRFAAAADKPGKARFQFGASAGDFADASNVELPVWTPATTEAFATYGVIDSGAIAQPVKMPDGVFTQFGGLEVTTSSTAMQGLTDAVVYLVRYPFECNEQLASRILAIASLRDVLSAFKSKDLPSPAALEAFIAADLDKLKARQKWDGGWGFWYGEEWPYISIHVAHALARAEAKGYPVNKEMRSRALDWLRAVAYHMPDWYDARSRRAIEAYALYVRRLLGEADPAGARHLVSDYGGLDKMDLEAIGWIWPTISEAKDKESQTLNAAIRTYVANHVTETAGAAHFVTSYGDGDYLLLHSDRRADGVLLEATILDEPESDLIPKLVKGLLAHRTAGRWSSTQENAFVLLALDKYFDKYEKVTPDFVARVWLGDKYAGDHAFHGRTTEYAEIDVPMSFLADVKQGDLTMAKEGAGRLYYRMGMKYAPTNLRPPPMDQGFTVTRTYEPVDDEGDVRKDGQGVWHVKAGKKVRVRVTMVAPDRRYHVALVDPIPAGFEPMNPALAVTGEIPRDPKSSGDPYWYWHSTWYEHQNMRDERVEAFATLVWEGVHEYVYTARATTPGTFVVPPPKAEEMYSPEVFGRGGGDAVVVE
jgi:uncharacterized protein YfaS (alpha-2-macroglobulin family)